MDTEDVTGREARISDEGAVDFLMARSENATNPLGVSLYSDRIEKFLHAAQAQSFSSAASRAGVSQPAFSAAIRSLEEELGFSLFDRSSSGVRLTGDGRTLYRLVLRHKRELDRELAEELGDPAATTLRIGCVGHFGAKYLNPLLPEIAGLPKLQLFYGYSRDCLAEVEAGRLDFAFISWTTPPKRIAWIRVKEDPVAVYGLRRRFRHIAQAESLEDLAGEPWVVYPKPQWDWVEQLPSGVPGYVAKDDTAFRELVLDGLAITDMQLDVFSDREIARFAIASGVRPRHPNTVIYAVHLADISSVAQASLHTILESSANTYGWQVSINRDRGVERHHVAPTTAPGTSKRR